MAEFQLQPLGCLVDDILDRRGVTPRKLGSEFVGHGHRVVSAKAIKDHRVDLAADEPRFVDEATYMRWMRSPLRADDVILTSEAPLGELAYLRGNVDWCLGQRLFAIRTDKAKLHGRYLHYALQADPARRDLLSRATGTTAQGIRQSELRQVEIPVPPLVEQRAIGHVLGTLDDKIELNRRVSETLEAMARALFKSWFVDFDPVRAKAEGRDTGLPKEITDLFPDRFVDSELGEIPEGWGVGAIGDLADIVGGSTPKTDRAEYWEGGTHHWVTPKDLSILSVPVLLDTSRRITDSGLEQIGSGLLPVGSVLLSSRAPIGYLAITEIPVAINQGFIAMKPCGVVSNHFLLRWAAFAHEEILSHANGSTFLEVSKTSFRPIQVVVPGAQVMSAFDRLAQPMHRKVVAHERSSRDLAALRDALLPKLVSGDLQPRSSMMKEAVV